MRALVCQRDHGLNLCCQEHRQHRSQTLESFGNFSCCAQCSDEMLPRMEAWRSPSRSGGDVSSAVPGRPPVWVPRPRPQRDDDHASGDSDPVMVGHVSAAGLQFAIVGALRSLATDQRPFVPFVFTAFARTVNFALSSRETPWHAKSVP